MKKIFDEIAKERKRQDEIWGGPEHDDAHYSYTCWFEFIRKQIRRYTPDARKFSGMSKEDLVKAIRIRLVRIAALAVAGIESIDRQNPQGS